MDAARREVTNPDGMSVVFGGETFVFPAELPLAVLDPLLDPELDLVGLITRFLGEDKADASLGLLLFRPDLPQAVLKAFYACYAKLMGAEQFDQFAALNPSVEDYGRLTKALVGAYGVSLGKFFKSGSSSSGDGETSKQTSPDSTTSTPAESSSSPDSPGSSASAG
jgi:hypothetical protein